jgi:acyl-CoA thioesterase-2
MASTTTHDDSSVLEPADFVVGVDFREVMELEQIEPDLFRANFVYDDSYRLYGGQVAAQALLAAGLTVDEDRLPHSLHGYFLRGGQCGIPTIFEVHRDRDGRSYSARRVVARQDGKAIFTSVMSFAVVDHGADNQVTEAPDVPAPSDCAQYPVPRLFSHQWALVRELGPDLPFPDRFWSRCTSDLGDDALLHAAAITYISDGSSGLGTLHDEDNVTGASLDHAVWFHQPVRADQWLFNDMQPARTAHGRGLYTGSMFTEDGTLAVSLAQQALFRTKR